MVHTVVHEKVAGGDPCPEFAEGVQNEGETAASHREFHRIFAVAQAGEHGGQAGNRVREDGCRPAPFIAPVDY